MTQVKKEKLFSKAEKAMNHYNSLDPKYSFTKKEKRAWAKVDKLICKIGERGLMSEFEEYLDYFDKTQYHKDVCVNLA